MPSIKYQSRAGSTSPTRLKQLQARQRVIGVKANVSGVSSGAKEGHSKSRHASAQSAKSTAPVSSAACSDSVGFRCGLTPPPTPPLTCPSRHGHEGDSLSGITAAFDQESILPDGGISTAINKDALLATDGNCRREAMSLDDSDSMPEPSTAFMDGHGDALSKRYRKESTEEAVLGVMSLIISKTLRCVSHVEARRARDYLENIVIEGDILGLVFRRIEDLECYRSLCEGSLPENAGAGGSEKEGGHLEENKSDKEGEEQRTGDRFGDDIEVQTFRQPETNPAALLVVAASAETSSEPYHAFPADVVQDEFVSSNLMVRDQDVVADIRDPLEPHKELRLQEVDEDDLALRDVESVRRNEPSTLVPSARDVSVSKLGVFQRINGYCLVEDKQVEPQSVETGALSMDEVNEGEKEHDVGIQHEVPLKIRGPIPEGINNPSQQDEGRGCDVADVGDGKVVELIQSRADPAIQPVEESRLASAEAVVAEIVDLIRNRAESAIQQ
ncbi:hypothetical protein HK102_010231, partial [Quaeritorhiza haematococci]